MKNRVDMLHGPLALPILCYAVPIMLTSVLQLLFHAADLVVVGAYCGSIAVAAAGATSAITNLLVNLFIGLSVGAGVTMAHSIGSQEWKQVHETVHTAVPLALVSGLFLTVLGVALAGKMLAAMGTPTEVLPLASTYMRIFFLGITFHLIYNFCASLLRASGDTRSPLVILTSAGVLNVLLNIVFVRFLGRNVDGVALATILSQAVSAVAILVVMTRRTDGCRLELGKLRFHGNPLGKMLRIGIPAGIQSSMFSASNVVLQSAVNSFGAVAVSGNAAVTNLEGFLYVIVNSYHQTAVNFVGQNFGALQFHRAKKITWMCMLYAAITALIVGSLMTLFGNQLLALYITDSPEAIALGRSRMYVDLLPYFLFGMQDVVTGALRGIGASLVTMILTVLGICGVRILWVCTIFQFPSFHNLRMLYLSYPLSWTITLAVQLAAFAILFRRMQRRIEASGHLTMES